MTTIDLEKTIKRFHRDANQNIRYASFDFCYLYFQENKGQLSQNMENSCLHLWSYLASWGMLRNSKLRLCSPAALKPLIEHFDIADNELWTLDVDQYNERTIQLLINEYKEIEDILCKILYGEKGVKHLSLTLITKIMLGVYGNIPAFDTYFIQTFHGLYGGFGVCGKSELRKIYDFYIEYKELIDELFEGIKVIDFDGHSTQYHYKKAKLIDMYGFSHNAPENN